GKGEKSEKAHRTSKGGSKEKKVAAADDKKGGGTPANAPDTGPKPAPGSIDALLLGATNPKKGGGGGAAKEEKKEAAPEPGSAGPLAKSAVVGGMNAVKPKIQDCYN